MNNSRERAGFCRTLCEIEKYRLSERNVTDIESMDNTCCDHLIYTDTIGSLCARDYKSVGSQYVEEGKLVIDIWN